MSDWAKLETALDDLAVDLSAYRVIAASAAVLALAGAGLAWLVLA